MSQNERRIPLRNFLLATGILAAGVGTAAFIAEKNGLSVEPVHVASSRFEFKDRVGLWKTEKIGVCPDGRDQKEKRLLAYPSLGIDRRDVIIGRQRDRCEEPNPSLRPSG